jgi:hypothetical protein
MATLIMPYSSMLLNGLRATGKEYLKDINRDVNGSGMDGIRIREFKPNTKSIRVELIVPKLERSESLGYILLKPIYKISLSTVNLIDNIPDFRDIYSPKDPRIKAIMGYRVEAINRSLLEMVLKFRELDGRHLIDALNYLNRYLLNHFTSYDRGLILSLALRESKLYMQFKESVESRDTLQIAKYLKILNSIDNPISRLRKILEATGVDYFRLIRRGEELLREKS